MKYIFATLLLSFSFCKIGTAQQFVNGSFENKGSIPACVDVTDAIYNTNMVGSWLSGWPSSFLGNSSCVPAPPNGSYCIAAKYDNTQGTCFIALKLDAPLIVGKKYRFSYDIIGLNTAIAASLRFGYSNDSIIISSSDTSFAIGDTAAPPTSTTSWLPLTDSFVANQPYSYFIISAYSNSGVTSATLIDNFRILNPNSVPQTNKPSTNVSVYPNPFTAYTSLNINSTSCLPGKLLVYDVLGTTIINKVVTEQNTYIDLSKAAKGIYIMKFTDKYNNHTTTKLINQ
jgi:hypothetical protein